MVLSMICTAFTFLFIFFLKGTQEHPMQFIMWYTGASFSFMWINFISPFVCQWNLDKLFQYTTLFIDLSTSDATYHLAEASRLAAIYFMSLTVAINMVLSIDLICTLRMPFQNPVSRYPYYTVATLLISIIPCVFKGSYLNDLPLK